MDAEQADLVLEFERLRASGSSPFCDTEAFLRNATGMSRSSARTRVQAFRQLLVLPAMRRALADGTVTFDHVRALAEHADSPNRDAVIDTEAELTGWAIDLSADRLARLATYHQRLALRPLHPTCAVEGCDMAFEWCEIHHLEPWEGNGRTDLDNLVPLCSYHHTWVHDLDGNVIMELLPDRTLRLPTLPLRPCERRRIPLVERLKRQSDLVGART